VGGEGLVASSRRQRGSAVLMSVYGFANRSGILAILAAISRA
jgi:hypothetical protein